MQMRRERNAGDGYRSRSALVGAWMKRKRVAGRFAHESGAANKAEGEGNAAETDTGGYPAWPPAPRPRNCRTYTRARLAEALPEILRKFVDEAKEGSIPHTKALTALSGLDQGEVDPPAKKRRSKSVAELILEEWDSRDASRIADSSDEQEESGSSNDSSSTGAREELDGI